MILDKFQEDRWIVLFHSKYTKAVDSGFVYVSDLGQATAWKSKNSALMWASMQRQEEKYTQICKMTIIKTISDNGEW